MSQRAFAAAAHPDDIEFGMAGTLILLKRAGWDAHYMNIANGSCGTAEHDTETIVKIRGQESKNAAERIGAVFHPPLVPDIEIYYERDTLAKLCSVVRDVAPDIMLIPSPQDYMEDHTNACRLAVSAAFCRGMRNYPVNPPIEPVSNDVTLYHAQPWGNRDQLNQPVHPDFFVNISDVMEEKTAMLAEHKSQKNWLDESQGLDAYLDTLGNVARDMGKLSGKYEFAEGWRRHLHAGLCAEDADPIADALKNDGVSPRFNT